MNAHGSNRFSGPKWPANHPVEILRDEPRLAPTDVRRHIARRCAWLASRIDAAVRCGEPCDLFVAELDALVQAAESFEKEHPSGGARPGDGQQPGKSRFW